MAAIPKKVIERYKKSVPHFQRIMAVARDRDVNEADTVSIIQGVLADVLGFDKYLEITSEFAIRSTYCDLAIKIDKQVQYLIEVKAIGIDLKKNHLRQAVDYAANHGVQWVVLTNGISWNLYKVRFERPINYKLVSQFDFLEINPRKADDQERLFLLSKRGLTSAREKYYERMQSVNRFVVGAIILSPTVIKQIKRDLKKLATGLKIDADEIEKLLRNDVLKREVLEGDDASKALQRVARFSKKSAKHSTGKREGVASSESSITSTEDQSIDE